MDKLRDVITTIYDALGLLAIAVGGAFAASWLIGWASIAVGGGIILVGVRVMDWVATPGQAPRWWRRIREGGRT
jgi:hypothetical protein